MEYSVDIQKCRICGIRESFDELTDDLVVIINKINRFLAEIDETKHS